MIPATTRGWDNRNS